MSSSVALFFLVTFFVALIYVFVKANVVYPFNGGRCKRCGYRLRKMDIFVRCGRGYKCSNCGKIVWISYSVDSRFNY